MVQRTVDHPVAPNQSERLRLHMARHDRLVGVGSGGGRGQGPRRGGDRVRRSACRPSAGRDARRPRSRGRRAGEMLMFARPPELLCRSAEEQAEER
jgi:hypothetical protein